MDIERIEQVTSQITGISVEQMHVRTRKREIVWARHLVYHFADIVGCKENLRQLGERYGQDHATVLNGRKKVRNLSQYDKEMKHYINQIACAIVWDFNAIPQF